MSQTNWNWDPIPRMRRHSRTAIRTVTTTRTTTDVNVDEGMDGLFAKLRATSEVYRQRRKSNFKPIEWSFKDIEISVSSEDSNDSNDNQLSANRVMTSTPQTNRKSNKQLLAITSGNRVQSSAKRSTKKALQQLPNIAINGQTSRMTPILSPKPFKALKQSSKRKSMAMNTTSFARKSFIPEYMERTILEGSPCASPFSPKTVVKKRKTFNKTYNNTTLFDHNFNEKTMTSTTTQTNDSLERMNASQEPTQPLNHSISSNKQIVEINKEVEISSHSSDSQRSRRSQLEEAIPFTGDQSVDESDKEVEHYVQSIESENTSNQSKGVVSLSVEESVISEDKVLEMSDQINESLNVPKESESVAISVAETIVRSEENEIINNGQKLETEYNPSETVLSIATGKSVVDSNENEVQSVVQTPEEPVVESNEKEDESVVQTPEESVVDSNESEVQSVVQTPEEPVVESNENEIESVVETTEEDVPNSVVESIVLPKDKEVENNDQIIETENSSKESNEDNIITVEEFVELEEREGVKDQDMETENNSIESETVIPIIIEGVVENEVQTNDDNKENSCDEPKQTDSIVENICSADYSISVDNQTNDGSDLETQGLLGSQLEETVQSIDSERDIETDNSSEKESYEENIITVEELFVELEDREEVTNKDQDMETKNNSIESETVIPIIIEDLVENEVKTNDDNKEDSCDEPKQTDSIVENSGLDLEPKGLRRSQRRRLPVLEYWRGQRPIYKRDSSGITDKIVDIEDGLHDIVRQRKKPTKKRKAESDDRHNREINIFDLSIHNKKFKINNENENQNSLHIKSMEDLIWKQSSISKGVDIAIINKNKAKGDALGMLRIQGMGEKNKTKTGGYTTHLTVIFGALSLNIDEKDEVVIRTGDSFTVDPNTSYSLVNLRKDIAYVSFTVLKD